MAASEPEPIVMYGSLSVEPCIQNILVTHVERMQMATLLSQALLHQAATQGHKITHMWVNIVQVATRDIDPSEHQRR
jgi:hypothetical protein